MDFNKLTLKSQEAVAAAQELARRMGNPELYPEHLLLALLDQELPQQLVPDAAALRAQAEATLRTKPSTEGAQQQPQVSAAVSRVLDQAFDEARRMEDEYVSTEHLLLAIAENKGDAAQRLLAAQGATREAILQAQRRHDDASEPPRILIVNGSARSEHTCPGEMSKTWRLVGLAEPVFAEMGFAVDVLDLSRVTSEYGRQIHPCKSCVATSMALCHWPCSCYPNYGLGQTDDWMNEIYPLWVAAHGIMIVAPVNWYHASSALKAMKNVATMGSTIAMP